MPLLGRQHERTIMGNAAAARELPGIEELDELYRLDASEREPEDEEEAGDFDEDEEEKPDVVPHG
jgi:hypothetical protein